MAVQKNKPLNSRAAINRIKVESLPSFTFSGNAVIVPWGLDNLYPFRIQQAIKKSPTALGCIKRLNELVFGQGLNDGGDTIVNRNGETLNDVVSQSVRAYNELGGFTCHFNFNALGEICEIFAPKIEHFRKHHDLKHVEFGLWNEGGSTMFRNLFITLDLYGGKDALRLIPEGAKFNEYLGQIYYFAKDQEINPTSPLDSASISASYEKEAQIYTYANIRNGFSGNTVIKLPTIAGGEDAKEESLKLQESIESMHGAEHSGSSIVVPVSTGVTGEAKNFTMIENLTPTNVDGLFVNQNEKAEKDILKVYNMPGEIIGISQKNGFAQTAYDAAWNMKNRDVQGDRDIIAREFNKFLPNSCFGVKEIELVPLDMIEMTQPQANAN